MEIVDSISVLVRGSASFSEPEEGESHFGETVESRPHFSSRFRLLVKSTTRKSKMRGSPIVSALEILLRLRNTRPYTRVNWRPFNGQQLKSNVCQYLKTTIRLLSYIRVHQKHRSRRTIRAGLRLRGAPVTGQWRALPSRYLTNILLLNI